MERDLPLPVASILYVFTLLCTMFVLCWNMPVLWGTALSRKRTQCPWNRYRPVLRVVFSKLTGLHQERNFSDSSADQHLMATGNNHPHDVPQAPAHPSGTTQRMSVPVRKCHLSLQPPQAIPTAPPTHTHHTLQRIFFSIDRLFHGTHSRTTYNHSRIVIISRCSREPLPII